MRDQSIYEINFPNRNIFDCVTRSHSTLFNFSAIGYLHRPSSCNNHRCPFSDTNRANVFVRTSFFFRTQDNKGDNVQNGKEERDGHITRKHGDSKGMKSAGTSRCSRFPVPSSTCQLLPNIRYSILRYTILLLVIMNIMYAIAWYFAYGFCRNTNIYIFVLKKKIINSLEELYPRDILE